MAFTPSLVLPPRYVPYCRVQDGPESVSSCKAAMKPNARTAKKSLMVRCSLFRPHKDLFCFYWPSTMAVVLDFNTVYLQREIAVARKRIAGSTGVDTATHG